MKNIPLRLDEHGIESLLVRSQNWLYNYIPQRVWFPKELYGTQATKSGVVHLFKKAYASKNNSFLDSELHNNKNMYALWTETRHYSKNWQLKYIGQSHSSGIRSRLQNHLFGMPFGAGRKPKSMFNEICKSLSQNKMIYVSYVQIAPESIRTFVEHSLICINIEKGEDLWNSHGTKNVARDLEDLRNSGINIKRILKV